MKTIRSFSLLIITMFLAGCPARSIHPLITEADAEFLPSLIGTWNNIDESYTFEPLQGKHYRLVVRPRDESDSAIYSVLSGKIGSVWFLDTYPIVNSDEHHYLSTHLITRINIAGDSLTLATLESDWLLKSDNEKKLNTPHVRREEEVILTGTTAELRKFVGAIGRNEEAFPEKKLFMRPR